ncbi:hypothetical protein [Leptospira kirschneri]|uniref:hypothetical protein n=1 Tax=Leptospira kirschneri TaxID=29507 RepID=UPI0002784F68|nr:hypothetical protein [Leptospira kirschneri]EJO69178.1 hypothetical protein LEP1GSC044_3564 [Leptospira kirschneri serovar Grippotyphosa str. RM52]EKP05964.1 hypothetical protein LEP1GSC018_1754 [Leptospira kirschneri str. 2008720114]EKQ85223.1 hypothetical protein LEP1GSC064_1587 [Leptospira kirschneri serovar Grippotyphosa str. Moskva]EKR06833.1 hypothetical protein LEP1GSC122_0993 [Leptospira kirschneri serovar Valbuzzi str. 200702274]EMN25049.1 hypothetical protein LEP1GSC065_2141 [Lept
MKLLSFKKFFLILIRTLTLVGIVSGSIVASGLNFNTQLPIKECFTNEITSSELSNLYKSILPLEEKKRIAEIIAYKEGKSRYQSIICIQNKNLSEEDHSKLFMDWNRHIFMYAELNSYYENYILSDEKTRSLNSIEWELLTTHLKQKKELLTRLNDATGFALNGEKISEENFSMIYLSLFLLQVEFWDAMPKTFRDSIL